MVSQTTADSAWSVIVLGWLTGLLMLWFLGYFLWFSGQSTRQTSSSSNAASGSDAMMSSLSKKKTDTEPKSPNTCQRCLTLLLPRLPYLKNYLRNRSQMAMTMLGVAIINESMVMRTLECLALLLRLRSLQPRIPRRIVWILVSLAHSFFGATLLVRSWRLFVRFKYYVQLRNVGWITLVSKIDVAGLDINDSPNSMIYGTMGGMFNAVPSKSSAISNATNATSVVNAADPDASAQRRLSHLTDHTSHLFPSPLPLAAASSGTSVGTPPVFGFSESVSTSMGNTSVSESDSQSIAMRNSFWLRHKTLLTSEKSIILTCGLLTGFCVAVAVATWRSFTLTRLLMGATMLSFPLIALGLVLSVPETDSFQKYEMLVLLGMTLTGWLGYTAWNIVFGDSMPITTGVFAQNLALWLYFAAFCFAFSVCPKQFAMHSKKHKLRPNQLRRDDSRGSSIMDIYRAMFEEFEAADKLSGFLAYSLGVFSAENVLALLECLEWKRKLRKEIERDASEAADSGLSLLSKVLKPYELPNRAVYNWDLHCSTVSLRKLGARSAIVSSKKLSFLSKARLLHRKYLSIDSPLQANVSHRVRDSIERVFLWFDQISEEERYSKDHMCALLFTFDTAMSEIIDNVYETFSSFQDSSL